MIVCYQNNIENKVCHNSGHTTINIVLPTKVQCGVVQTLVYSGTNLFSLLSSISACILFGIIMVCWFFSASFCPFSVFIATREKWCIHKYILNRDVPDPRFLPDSGFHWITDPESEPDLAFD